MMDSKPNRKIKSANIKAAIAGVLKLAAEDVKLQNTLFNDEISVFLQINSFKIPKGESNKKVLVRVPLAHSPLPEDADVCLIVPDVKGIPNKEHERHVEHYEKLLSTKGVTGIKKIMTFHEFRTEYSTFELKNRLVDLYDVFLVDGRISGKAVHKSGKIFYKKRKVPIAVKLQATKLDTVIRQALNKAFFLMSNKSDSHSVQIGHTKMDVKHLIENVRSVEQFLSKKFPGGFDNIRSISVYCPKVQQRIPCYLSLKNPNSVKIPEKPDKDQKLAEVTRGDLSTLSSNNLIKVTKLGKVTVEKKRKPIN